MSRTYRSSVVTFNSDTDEVKEDPDYVYYNADIINNGAQADPVGIDRPDPVIRFSETRDAPLITDASKYNFSIIRFSMDGAGRDLPNFIPVIRLGANNPTNNVNLTAYDAGLSVVATYTVGATTATFSVATGQTGAQFSQAIIYETETLDTTQAPNPSPDGIPNGRQDLSSRYYWVYTVSHWVNLVNKAYLSAWGQINTAFRAWYATTFAVPAIDLTTVPPRLTYNPSNGLFTIYADRYGFGDNQITPYSPNPLVANRTSAGTASDENWAMFMDANLFGMFSFFDNQYVNLPGNFTNKILITNVAGIYQNILSVSSPPAPVAKSYWVMVQDHKSDTTLWSPVASIVFTSGTLPLVFENTAQPVKFGSGNVGDITNSQNDFVPIISDTQLYTTSSFDYRDFFQYAPSAEYRLSAFQKSRTAISQIDIQVFWKNRLDGNLYPLTMYNLSSVSIKIMFRRRGVGDFPHPARKDPVMF